MTSATLMFPPKLHVIGGGVDSSVLGCLAASPARCVAIAEAAGGRAVACLAPAVALTLMSEAQLVQIAAADVAEAVRTRDAFRDAAAAALAVLDVLKAAETRLLEAIAAVPRDGLATS